MLPETYTIVDVETTGGRPSHDRMIEVGLLRVEHEEVVATYETLINPTITIPSMITQITGISFDHIAGSPTFADIADDLLPFFRNTTLVAHNANFDYGFLKEEFNRLEIPFSTRRLCTVKLSRNLFPEFKHHNLDSIISRYHFAIENRHRALDDARILWHFLQHVTKTFPIDIVKDAVKKALQRPMLPPHISKETIEGLPETHGIYTFFGKDNAPLYVGKSNNIKERVLSHFSSANNSGKEFQLSQQTQRITYETTAGELTSLLREADLVKSMQPIFNHQLRRTQQLVIATAEIDLYGYPRIKLHRVEKITPDMIPSILGIYRSIKQAKQSLLHLLKEHTLCDSLMGLEKCNGACFGYRLNRCQGACIQKENPIEYTTRFTKAFERSKLERWPYDQPLIISESNPTTGQTMHHIIDQWCYLGMQENPDTQANAYIFDLDTYRILQRHIRTRNILSA